jgi:cyclic pyranopterin phosphate synthase
MEDIKQLTHLDEHGSANMVDIGAKPASQRVAIAAGRVRMAPQTLELIRAGNLKKGDVLGAARIAGIMAAKRTAELVPLCHPIPIDKIALNFVLDAGECAIDIEATVTSNGRTGVEMEALTAVSVAGLTIYDMAKAADRGMRLTDIRLLEKRGGVRGDFRANE